MSERRNKFCHIFFSAIFAFDENEAPKITQQPLDMEVVRNEPVTLNCRASGSPPPTIEWFKADTGEPVRTAPLDPLAQHRILLPDGSLFFLSAKHGRKEQDTGVYYCVASNEVGAVRSVGSTSRSLTRRLFILLIGLKVL